MTKDYSIYLRHILDAITSIQEKAGQKIACAPFLSVEK